MKFIQTCSCLLTNTMINNLCVEIFMHYYLMAMHCYLGATH